MKKFTVNEEKGLTDFLLDEYKGALKYGRLMKLYREKDIKVNGSRVNADTLLHPGDFVDVYYDGETRINVIYSDDDIVVCDKPAGIESVAFYEQVRAVFPSAIFTHRLDRNTSGIMIFALNQKAYDLLFAGFRDRTFDKIYYACVYGAFEKKNDVLKDYMFKDEKAGRVSVFSEYRKGALPVETGYEELAYGEKTSVLAVKLYTGRTHQIRAHLAYYGHFVIGDGKYGDDRINRELGIKKQLLRAVKLVLHFSKGDYLYRLNGKEFSVNGDMIFAGLK